MISRRQMLPLGGVFSWEVLFAALLADGVSRDFPA